MDDDDDEKTVEDDTTTRRKKRKSLIKNEKEEEPHSRRPAPRLAPIFPRFGHLNVPKAVDRKISSLDAWYIIFEQKQLGETRRRV